MLSEAGRELPRPPHFLGWPLDRSVSPDVLGPIVTFGDCCAAGGRCPRTSGAGACGTAPLSVVAGAGCEVPSRCAGGALV